MAKAPVVGQQGESHESSPARLVLIQQIKHILFGTDIRRRHPGSKAITELVDCRSAMPARSRFNSSSGCYQRVKAGARVSISVIIADDDSDANWMEKTNSSRSSVRRKFLLVNCQPQAATRHANKSSQTRRHVVALGCDARGISKYLVWLRLCLSN